MATTTAIFASSLFSALLSYVTYQAFFSPLQNIPGPFLAKFCPLWRVYRVMLGNWHEDIVKLHDQYGTASRPFHPFPAFFPSNRNCHGV